MGQPCMSVFATFVNGLVASDVGRFPDVWNIRETHPKGGPVRTLVRYQMRTQDPALPEDAQNINKLAHTLRKVLPPSKGDRTGRPGTTDEQRAKDTESRIAARERGTLRLCMGFFLLICCGPFGWGPVLIVF